MGSRTSHASYKIVTPSVYLQYMQRNGTRSNAKDSTPNGQSSLKIHHLSSPTDLEQDLRMEDYISLERGFQIRFAERRLVGPDGKRVTSKKIPSGIYIQEGKKETTYLDEVARTALVEQTQSILQEFRDRFGQTLTRRVARVGELYPIQPEKFFGDGYGDGIGPIFREQFLIQGMGSCCDPTLESGAGFQVSAETDRYTLKFYYQRNSPMKGNWDWLAGSLYVNRGNHGFKIAFDDQFQVRRIQEIGAPNILIDTMYSEDDFKSGLGKRVYESVMRMWEEVRSELSIDERIELCEGLTAQELHKAEEMITSMRT